MTSILRKSIEASIEWDFEVKDTNGTNRSPFLKQEASSNLVYNRDNTDSLYSNKRFIMNISQKLKLVSIYNWYKSNEIEFEIINWAVSNNQNYSG